MLSKDYVGENMPLEISSLLREKLTPELFLHCSGVAKTAVQLAANLGCCESQAEQAGWLHDCARNISEEELLRLAEAHNIEIDRFSRQYPVLLHAPVGEVMARSLGFTDETVLDAIRCHTLGFPGMGLLAKIVYAADKIEPGRSYPGVEELRLQVQNDFHAGLVAIVAQSINYVLWKKQAVHPLTLSFWNWLTNSPG
jgi:predicted HD superfamily hydrolase involved in NAD metabolism